MKQELKELLIKDLCARLPYGLKVKRPDCGYYDYVSAIDIDAGTLTCQYNGYTDDMEKFKPYLCPMSNMTEEEKVIQRSKMRHEGYFVNPIYFHTIEEFDYLNSIHVDYRGLIEKGIALEAPEGMYNIKEK